MREWLIQGTEDGRGQGQRRKQLQTSVKHMGEQAKVTIRNARRDANKHIDAAGKDKTLSLSEDVIDKSKKDVEQSASLLKVILDCLDVKV